MGINDYLKVGTQIKSARKKRGMKQKDLAEELGISAATLANYESNRREPDLDTVIDIASILDVDLDFFTQIVFTDPDVYREQTRKIVNMMKHGDIDGLTKYFNLNDGDIIAIRNEQLLSNTDNPEFEPLKKYNHDLVVDRMNAALNTRHIIKALLDNQGYKITTTDDDNILYLTKDDMIYHITAEDIAELERSTLDFFKFKVADILNSADKTPLNL